MELSNKSSIDLSDTSMLNILKFVLPIITTSFLQQLFNSADSAIVGRFVSHQALAAVGGNATPICLLINLLNGLAVGANVVVSKLIGENKKDKVKDSVFSIMALSLISGLIVAVVGVHVAEPLLIWIKTPNDTIDMATQYLKIIMLGMPFLMIFNFGSAILRSNGETKKPLIALVISGVVNIVLNVFFVVVLMMSVKGVAIATIISNFICATVVVLDLINRKDCLNLSFKTMRLDKDIVVSTLKIGLPAGIQASMFSISNTIILSAINSFGSASVAASTISVNFEIFSNFLTAAFVNAVVSFVSHNYGANDFSKCKAVYRNCLVLALIWEGGFDLLVFIFRYPLIGIFTTKTDVVELTLKRMNLVCFIHFFVIFYEIPGGYLRGFGKSLVPAVITVFCCCGVRLFWVFIILPLHRTFQFLFIVYPISWFLCAVGTILALHICLGNIQKNIGIFMSQLPPNNSLLISKPEI